MKTVRVNLPAGLYRCAIQEAKKRGALRPERELASLLRGALRAYLNRNGFTVDELDEEET